MRADSSFVEVRASRNAFSKDYARRKKLALPRSWTPGASGDSWLFSPILPLTSAAIGIAGIVTGNAVLGTIIVGCSIAAGYWCRRRSHGLSTIGAGRITIRREGFIDERLGAGQIRWRHITKACTVVLPRLGQLLGVQLWSDGGASVPVTSPSYEDAYSLRKTRNGPDLFIDLKGVREDFEIAEAIHILIEDARENGLG